MQQFSHILPRLVFLFSCLFLASGCANNPSLQATSTQGTTTQGTTNTCTGTCTPGISLDRWSVGLKPGASSTFSANAYNVSDHTVTWTIKEGSAGGAMTDAGVYTAPSVEGFYH